VFPRLKPVSPPAQYSIYARAEPPISSFLDKLRAYSVGPTHDWEGRGGLDVFDDCMVRVGIVGSRFGGEGICAGLSLSAGDDPVYLPFGLIRARGGYHCEDATEQLGTIRVYLDEWAPSES
jgi:hypothetical protein